jgi:8-oxo-dGTP pyrophosphatase MutT (NUDIX family)
MTRFKLPIKAEVILYTVQDKFFNFLLLKRIPEEGGFWQPLTGTLESQESLGACIYREIKEEIGLGRDDIKKIDDMFFSFSWYKDKSTNITEFVFAAELKRGCEISLGEEHDDYRWCSFDEAVALLGKKNNKRTLSEFRRKFMS